MSGSSAAGGSCPAAGGSGRPSDVGPRFARQRCRCRRDRPPGGVPQRGFGPITLAFAVAVGEVITAAAHLPGELGPLLQHAHDSVVIRRPLPPPETGSAPAWGRVWQYSE